MIKQLEELLDSTSFPPSVLDQYSEEEIRAVLDSGTAGKFEPILRAWVHGKDLERTRRSLEAAERSTRAAERAARFAMWAAVIAVVGLVIALAAK